MPYLNTILANECLLLPSAIVALGVHLLSSYLYHVLYYLCNASTSFSTKQKSMFNDNCTSFSLKPSNATIADDNKRYSFAYIVFK